MCIQQLSSTYNFRSLDVLKVKAISSDLLKFLADLQSAETGNKPILYHPACKQEFQYYFQTRLKKQQDSWHKKRLARKIAFRKICTFVHDNVIVKKNSYHITFLQEMYSDITKQLYEHANLVIGDNFYVPFLKEQILKVKSFSNKLKFIKIQSKQVLVPSGVSDINIQTFNDRELFDECAYRLREIIKTLNITKLSSHVNASDLIKGECENVSQREYFFEKLLTGYNSRRKVSPTDRCRARTLASDTIFGVHHGKVMPSKHISLAMTIKSMSSNKSLLTLMNRLGYTINYSKLLQLETQVAESSLRR